MLTIRTNPFNHNARACLTGMALLLSAWLLAPMSLWAQAVGDSEDQAFAELLNTVHQDDLFAMLERGRIRVGVTYSKTHYFLDHGKEYGIAHETLQALQQYLKSRYKSRLRGRSLVLVPVPLARDELLPRLEQGYLDLVMANLTITPERAGRVSFTAPTLSGVSEVIVAAPTAPALASLEDLSGKLVMVRESSSFMAGLAQLNQALSTRKRPPVQVMPAYEYLETEDLIEMANASLVDYVVADSHIAGFWQQIFPQVKVYNQLALVQDQDIAWAVRKGTPELLSELNRFLKDHRVGTTFGNVLKNRYLKDTHWASTALATEQRAQFSKLVGLFRQYGEQYQFDYLMLIAQAYQESHLDHTRKSHVGAIGIMQIMPNTGKQMAVGDIHQLENNVHAGAKYLRYVIDEYFNDPAISEQDRMLFGFAAYNAGPTRIARLRETAARMQLDPNVWFRNVEHAVARHVGRETVNYVANIAKYYVAYKLITEQQQTREQLKASYAE